MSTPQEILNILHDGGFTDSDLGEALEVSREHISRLRHGSKNASEWLTGNIRDLYKDFSGAANGNVAPSVSYEGAETSSIPWGLIIGVGVLIAVVVVAVIMTTRESSSSDQTEEEKSQGEKPESPEITYLPFPNDPNQFPGMQS